MSRWPKMKPGYVQAVLAGHSALGLAFAALLYLVCLSGTIVVFEDEIRQWEEPGAVRTTADPDDSVVAAAAASISERAATQDATVHSLSIWPPELGGPWLRARFYADDGTNEQWYVDPQTGALAEEAESPLARFLVYLHDDLHLPGPWGRWLVGLTGVAMLSLVISGLLAHPRIFRDAFHLRWGGSKRLQEADLHNRLSVWALPFHLVISFTGAFLGLAFLIVAVLAFAAHDGDQAAAVEAVLGPQASEDSTPVGSAPLEQILADARARNGGGALRYLSIEHPGEAGGIVSVSLEAPDDLAPAEVFVYGATGEHLATIGNADGPAGLQTLAAMGPLHFGLFGGLPVKLLYGVLGLASTVVAAGGVTIWLARRADKGRPAPRWARVWTAVVWGAPLGFALAPLAVLTGVASPGAAFLAGLLAAFAAAAIWTAEALSRGLRAAVAAALVFAVTGHGALYGLGAPPAALWANAVLLALALILVLSIRPVRDLLRPSTARAAA